MPKFTEAMGLNLVSEFHDLFDLPVEKDFIIPSEERTKLRINLIEEELQELKEAIKHKDKIEVADAFCDLQYVLSGAILEFGLASKFAHLFDKVHQSNMSKASTSLDIAQKTQSHYLKEKQTESFIKQKGDKFLVYRKSDGKVLKSVEYSPVDIVSGLEE